MTRHPFCRMLGGLQGWSGRVRKIKLPTGFDPRTVQPLASRYTDWAIPAHRSYRTHIKSILFSVYFLNAYTIIVPIKWEEFLIDWTTVSLSTTQLPWLKFYYNTVIHNKYFYITITFYLCYYIMATCFGPCFATIIRPILNHVCPSCAHIMGSNIAAVNC
jgi:hypothetical protein